MSESRDLRWGLVSIWWGRGSMADISYKSVSSIKTTVSLKEFGDDFDFDLLPIFSSRSIKRPSRRSHLDFQVVVVVVVVWGGPTEP